MPILTASEQLIKLSEEKIRIPADVDTTQDNAPCPQCGIPYDGEVCDVCGFVAPKAQEAIEIYEKQSSIVVGFQDYTSQPCPNKECGREFDGLSCEHCGFTQPPYEFRHPRKQRPEGQENFIGRDDNKVKFIPWEDPRNPKKKKKKNKKKAAAEEKDNSDLGDIERDPSTRIPAAEQSVLQMENPEQKQGAIMSRFDDELTKEAAVPGVQYDQTSNMYLDGPFGLSSQSPKPEEDAWKDIYPDRFLDVRDLDASATDVMGGPGNNAVRAEDDKPVVSPQVQGVPAAFEQPGLHPLNASAKFADNPDSDVNSGDADAGEENNKEVMKEKNSARTEWCKGEGCKIPNCDGKMEKDASYKGIEEKLYKVYEASRDLRSDLKTAKTGEFTELKTRLATVLTKLQKGKKAKTASVNKIGNVKYLMKFASDIETGLANGTLKVKEARKALKEFEAKLATMSTVATNGNQETDYQTQVQNLDDVSGPFDRQFIMTPDFKTNVLVPNEQPNQLALADVPDDYNDGGETGYGLAYNYNRNPWPNDATNPALAPFDQSKAAAVQNSREKILEAIEVVDRLERMGMVQSDDRANHIAKFEQMSDAKLAGFKASIDMLEESGARQPRSQKVASGANRLPEMGRLTTASTVGPMDVKSDDFLMTL